MRSALDHARSLAAEVTSRRAADWQWVQTHDPELASLLGAMAAAFGRLADVRVVYRQGWRETTEEGV